MRVDRTPAAPDPAAPDPPASGSAAFRSADPAPAEYVRFRDAWQRALARADTTVLCAERDGTVLGAAAFRLAPDAVVPATATLRQLHVDPAHWRQGIGTALLHACRDAWRDHAVSRALLEVFWHNRRARAFYTRHGWQPDPDRPPAPDATHLHLFLPLGTAITVAP
ncbi:GNAT family N-acetyltransferase [Streptomyces sp. MST-110588]|nr:GNAT family N-acetyltransferase [Streptomyces sp. MST-110588]